MTIGKTDWSRRSSHEANEKQNYPQQDYISLRISHLNLQSDVIQKRFPNFWLSVITLFDLDAGKTSIFYNIRGILKENYIDFFHTRVATCFVSIKKR